jgi:hypothetical protein
VKELRSKKKYLSFRGKELMNREKYTLRVKERISRENVLLNPRNS